MNEHITLQKALVTIKKLKSLLEQKAAHAQPIAIVGLSCRYPDAIGKNAYWELLSQGKNIISEMPEERWQLLKGSSELALRDPTHPYWGGYLKNIADFDPYFFGISPREAVRMDPQHRLILEVAYEAIEDAGIPVESLAGTNTGVFASLYVSQLAHLQEMESELDALYLPTGNAISIAGNRLSYLFDLRGPSVIIDSACSASMVGIHLACLHLQNKLCDMALVCGAKLNVLPYVNLVLSKAKMLSPDGQCKTFDADANGYVQGEGVGVIVLKPLDKALRDNDRIYAIVCGSAVNQDGKTNGLTAPNGLQQEKLLKAAYQQAHINPQQISYVECHGTGTFLGDPIEIQALGDVVGKNRDPKSPCWIGSVKTNIGHLEPGAGVASLIKVALSLQHQQIPPHLNFSNPNPHIAFDRYHLRVPTQMENWPKYGDFRVAGISGFGFGGTNAHLVVRETTAQEQTVTSKETMSHPEVFTVSAKDTIALKLLIDRWVDYLKNNRTLELAVICHNIHLRRSHYSHRIAILADSTADLYEQLMQLQTQDLSVLKNSEKIMINLTKESNRYAAVPDMPTLKMNAIQLATLYIHRATIPWAQYEEGRRYPLLEMPLYPWQHKSYWPTLGHASTTDDVTDFYPLQGKKLISPLETLQFEFKINTKQMPDIKDTYNVLHAGYYLEMFAFITDHLHHHTHFTVHELTFLSPLIVPNDVNVAVQIILHKQQNDQYQFHVYSNIQGQKNWVEHAHGALSWEATSSTTVESIDKIKSRSISNHPAEKLYEKVIAMGMPAGDSIRWTHHYWLADREVLCEFQQPKAQRANSDFKLQIHPGVIDGSIQPLFMLLPEKIIKPYIASQVKKLKFFGIKPGPYYLRVTLKKLSDHGEEMICHSILMNTQQDIIFEAEDVCLTQLDNKFEIQKFMQANTQECIDLSTVPVSERKHVITQFLTTQVAHLFSMPKEDVSIHRPLSDMGIDSLMALVLMRAIEIGLGTSYSMQDLLQGPAIVELADTIAKDSGGHHQEPQATANKWIAYREPQKSANIRLFCFPYGGGGASIYRDWQKHLPNTIEVCPIQLPGREDRMNETPMNNVRDVVESVLKNIQSELNKPFAFLGHSFGTLIAFELSRTLRRNQMPEPTHLFASAFPDPRNPTRSLDRMLEQLKEINLSLFELTHQRITTLDDSILLKLSNIFSENGITGYSDHSLDKDIIKVLLPIFVGDMRIVKSYSYYEEPPFNFPITVFRGKKDNWVTREEQSMFQDHSKQPCHYYEFDSGHLFLKDIAIRDQMLKIISEAILEKQTA